MGTCYTVPHVTTRNLALPLRISAAHASCRGCEADCWLYLRQVDNWHTVLHQYRLPYKYCNIVLLYHISFNISMDPTSIST